MPPLIYTLLGLLLLSYTAPRCSSAGDTLAAGQTFAAVGAGAGKLVSRNGKYALGFFQPATMIASTMSSSKSHHNTSSSSSWYFGIWFNKIPVFTTVWVANREEPISHPNINSTQLRISSDGNLVIIVDHVDAGTESLVWSTHIVNRTQTTTTTTTLVLLNSGNLVLLPTNASQEMPSWQSFDHPTDVVLPGVKLGWDKVTGLSNTIISKKSLINPGLGSYSVGLEGATGMVLKRRNNPSVVYWQFVSSTTSTLVPIIQSLVDLDPRIKGLVNPIYVDNNREEYYMYTSPDESPPLFVSLDTSGQTKMMFWSPARQTWETIGANPDGPCMTPATCGPFAVCNNHAHILCECMEGFSQKSPQDWEFNDRTGGCIRNTPLQYCGTSEKNMTSSTDMFHPIAQATLPYKPQLIALASTQTKCEEACLSSCSCTAYSFNNDKCSVWYGELLSVSMNDGIDFTAEDVLYIRLAAKDLSFRKNKRKPHVGVVTAGAIIGFGLLMIMVLLLIWMKKFKVCGLPLYGNQDSGGGIMAFRFTDLVRATKNFSEKLGGGGFGSVYKGVLNDSTSIAVKRLDGACQGEKQFRAEVSSVGLIQHINIVKLIGFCSEGDKRLLVYEHMSNGSLDVHLFKKSNANGDILNWNTRFQITLGIARGLSYLHQSCRQCIIHCDIKPENILLDASFVPKVADFGLAALVGRDFSRILTTFRGTIGYLAPEWLSGNAITPKIDVYSFGMVLLEIISGARNSSGTDNTRNNHSAKFFPVQAIHKLHGGDVQSLVDPNLHGDFNLEEVERVCKVACWCIQDNEFDRPAMGEMVRVLEGLQEIDMPPMPRQLAAMTEQYGVTSSIYIVNSHSRCD
ncbi:hypothetical protein CFC21_009736 [Triticum aestivum]|uniref:Receptor-like serine/threonine-protein kinase n=2 Tax=Triticum aestivum TaxID=4565 RepID=A0A9R1DJ13_WHEAT|nr:G-type lectin S-receptor-like serine/threonine-protein kinase At2g19130 [Triticum aestivum]KAF6992773.1 hypothetical protein CFC21_009736 [Triticum aestivum]